MYLGSSGRTEAWNFDPIVARHFQPRAHRAIAGFDRGHQLPSADRTYSKEGNSTTFYFTNITVQNASLNRGVWSTLENRVRTWVTQCDTLYVVAGAMITTADDNEIRYAKDNDGLDVAIPKYYFKVIAQKRGANYYTIAYRFDNIAPTNRNLNAYEMTVSALEDETGFVFFPMLPKETKEIIVEERWR
jgi:endonuclease G